MAEAPHIVLVMTDQQRFDTIHKTGSTWMEPHTLDRLVRKGVCFRQLLRQRPFLRPPSWAAPIRDRLPI